MNWLSKMGLTTDGNLSFTSLCMFIVTIRVVAFAEWAAVAALLLLVANYVHRRQLIFMSQKNSEDKDKDIFKAFEEVRTQLNGFFVSQGFQRRT